MHACRMREERRPASSRLTTQRDGRTATTVSSLYLTIRSKSCSKLSDVSGIVTSHLE